MPARSIDTATIAFGLVSIPVKIYSTSEPTHEIHFHLIHEGCGERLKQQYICPKHGEVSRAEMSKGYELTKGNFVELSKEELKNLEAVASEELAMKEFVPATAIDPIYVDRTYYLGPGKGGERAYRLFRDALEQAGLVGVASYSARGKQYVVMVRPYEDGLAMHQLRYPDEIKPWDEVPLGKLPKPQTAELHLAEQIIAQLRESEFHADKFKDEVKGRVRQLIAKKAKGGEIVAPPEAPKPEVTDLMAALKASLAGGRAAPAADDKGGHDGHAKHGHAKHGHAHAKHGHAKTGQATHKRTSRARPAAHGSHHASSSHRRAHK